MTLLGSAAAGWLLVQAASCAWGVDVDVRLSAAARKAYDIEGVFLVKASSSAVWDVLTDYDHIDGFVSSMRLSRVEERRADGAVVVDQEAVGGGFLFSRRVRVRLEVRREGPRLAFKDLRHADFRRYEGAWEARQTPDGTEVRYRLHAEPEFLAPSLLLKRGFRRGAGDLLAQVRREILRRTAEAAKSGKPGKYGMERSPDFGRIGA